MILRDADKYEEGFTTNTVDRNNFSNFQFFRSTRRKINTENYTEILTKRLDKNERSS